MSSVLSVIIVFGVIVFVHELGHFICAKLTGMRVDEFAIGFGPKVAGIKKGETLYSIRAIPLGGFNKIAGMEMGDEGAGERAYWRKPVWARLIVIAAGAIMNFILPIFLIAGSLYFYGVSTPSSEPIIGKVIDDSPAYIAGLKANDKILSINGKPISNWEEISTDFKNKEGTAVKLEILRAGEQKNIQVFPKVNEENRAIIGITPTFTVEKLSLSKSASGGVKAVVAIIGQMYHGLGEMILGHSKVEISGPIGVAQMTSQYAKMGMESLIFFTSILSINLGVINLLPIPALDGGHIIMLIVEAIRRKPLPPSFLKKIQMVGVTLLLALMIFATTKDIFKLLG